MKKLRIATITFNGAANYGARLQTYALQRVIEALGYESEVLNFDNPVINMNYKVFHRHMLAHPRSWAHVLVDLFSVPRRNRRFVEFTKKHIKQTKQLCTAEELAQEGKKFDVLVTGSDQVFNGTLHGHREEYFLSFTEIEKNISYAGSFGFSQVPEGEEDWYKHCLTHLGQISCREDTGARLVQALTGREATVDLDPVFLLAGTEWSEVIHDDGADYALPEEYIFTYMLDTNLVSELAEKMDLPLVNVQFSRSLRSRTVGKNIYDAGPAEFVKLLRGARYVLTGSFHATVFSLLMHKPFLTVVPPKVGSRIIDLLSGLKLNNHLWQPGAEEIPNADWARVDEELAVRRAVSLGHLRQMILRVAGKDGCSSGQD